ncbi:hypothetical protein HAX54_043979, partial [Datura stramonium]|nr:hypothetical protein [Datura stramonium]
CRMADPQGKLDNVFVDVNDDIDYASTIIPPRVNSLTFKIDWSIYVMLKAEGQFFKSIDQDLHQHLKNFLEVCNMHKQNNLSNDALYLRVFDYLLVERPVIGFIA